MPFTLPNFALLALGSLGAFICLLNFYLSVFRFPIHKLRHGSIKDLKYISGFPFVGSLFVGALLGPLDYHPIAIAAVLLLALLDTGGIHWCIVSLILQRFKRNKSN